MGLQEHAGDMEQKPDEELDVQQAEQKDEEVSSEEAAADVDGESEKQDAKEEGPKSRIEEMVADATKGGPPPVEKMVELALVFGCMPGTAEYDEMMGAVQKYCGNGYAEQVEAEFAKADEEPLAAEDKAQEEQSDEPPPEAEAAEDQSEEKAADPGVEAGQDAAALEQEGPASAEVPEELKESPVVQEELSKNAEESETNAPEAEEVKAENAEAVEAEPAGEAEEKQEEEAGPPQADLRRGDHSPEVEELQNLLVSMGFMTQEEMDTGPGIFGPRTEHALKAYQGELGLPATGFYGPMTRESLAKAAEPPSKMEQIVLEIIAREGPEPDFAVMVGVFMTIDPGQQAEFMIAVANQCSENYATALQAEIENAASAPAEESEQKPEEASSEPANQESTDDEKMSPEEEPALAAKPEEAVESNAPPEEIAEVKAEVVEVAPEAVPEESQEQVQAEKENPEAPAQLNADETKDEESTSPAEEATEEAQEEQKDASSEDVVAAEPTAEPEEKEQQAQEAQDAIAEEPEAAQVEGAPEQSEEEVEAKKEDVGEELEEEVEQQPDNSQSIAALQALLEEADRLLGNAGSMLADPVLDTTQDTIQADAEAMLASWDGDLENYVNQLEEMADKLGASDLGQTPGMEEALQQASGMSEQLRAQAAQLKVVAPSNVTVNVALTDGTQMAFDVPISGRDTAVAEILNAFLQQLELRENEQAEEESTESASEAPPEA